MCMDGMYGMEREAERLQRMEMIREYRTELEKLLKYIPWLEKNRGQNLSTPYAGDDVEKNSIAFPVYDGTLLNFIRELSATRWMNRNYMYDYRRYRIENAEEEKRVIARAGVKELGLICSILSRYAMKGRTKGSVWSEGVINGVYLDALLKIKAIILQWDKRPFT